MKWMQFAGHIYKNKMMSGLRVLKANWLEGGLSAAQEYGKRIAAMIK